MNHDLEQAVERQHERLDQRTEDLEARQAQKQAHLWRGWESATNQMMKRITTLEKELKENSDHRPTLLIDALEAHPTNTVVRTMNVLAAKEKERDGFVETTSKMQDFIERLASLECPSGNLQLRLLIQDAQAVLKVSELHNYPFHIYVVKAN